MLKRADSLSRGLSLGRSFGPNASLRRPEVKANVAGPNTDTIDPTEVLPAPPPTKKGLGVLGSFVSRIWSGRQENHLITSDPSSLDQIIEPSPSLQSTGLSPTNSTSNSTDRFRSASNEVGDRTERDNSITIYKQPHSGVVNGGSRRRDAQHIDGSEGSKNPAGVESLMQQLAHMSLASDHSSGLKEPPVQDDDADEDAPRGALLRATGHSVSRSGNSRQRNGSRNRHSSSTSASAKSSSVRGAPAWTTSAAAILTGGSPLHQVQGYANSEEAYKARIELLAMPAAHRKIVTKRVDSGQQDAIFSRERGEVAAGTARRTLLLERTHNALRRKQEREQLPPRSPVVKAPPTLSYQPEPPKVYLAAPLK